MWSLILYLLFGVGQPSNNQVNDGATMEALGDIPGETETPRPPKG